MTKLGMKKTSAPVDGRALKKGGIDGHAAKSRWRTSATRRGQALKESIIARRRPTAALYSEDRITITTLCSGHRHEVTLSTNGDHRFHGHPEIHPKHLLTGLALSGDDLGRRKALKNLGCLRIWMTLAGMSRLGRNALGTEPFASLREGRFLLQIRRRRLKGTPDHPDADARFHNAVETFAEDMGKAYKRSGLARPEVPYITSVMHVPDGQPAFADQPRTNAIVAFVSVNWKRRVLDAGLAVATDENDMGMLVLEAAPDPEYGIIGTAVGRDSWDKLKTYAVALDGKGRARRLGLLRLAFNSAHQEMHNRIREACVSVLTVRPEQASEAVAVG